MLGSPRWTGTSADVLFAQPPEEVRSDSNGAVRLVLSSMAEARPARQLSVLASTADRQRVIRAHARWDATNSALISFWLGVAAQSLADYRQILTTRLTATPNDVVLLRSEQDGASNGDKATVCARHRARSEAAPDDADLSYVATRCLTDPGARSQAFLDGHRRWPQSGWFAYAAGYAYAEADQWGQALGALEQAHRTVRPLAEDVAVDLARVHRLLEDDPRAAVALLAKTSDRLRYLVALESGAGLDSGPLLAYPELARGHLERALELARSDSSVEARVLRLAAASDGASPDLAARALALGSEAGLDEATRWASIGLAARLGRDVMPFSHVSDAWPQDYTGRILTFVDGTRGSVNPLVAEQALRGLPLWLRGEAYSMGVIILGSRAPLAWRRAAKRLLFAPERPYFN